MAQIERFFHAICANGANRAFRAALTNQELALALRHYERRQKIRNNNGGQSNCGCMWVPGAVYTSSYFYKNRNTFSNETGAAWQKHLP